MTMLQRGSGLARAALWAACVLVVTGCGGGEARGGADEGALELTLGHPGAPASLFGVITDEYARRVNEALDGRAHLTVFGSSQLGTDQALLQKLKLGTVDLMLASTILVSEVEALSLFEMPYLVRDRSHMERIARQVFWPDLAPAIEAAGYHTLALWENGFRHLTNSRAPVRVPADLEGLKLRTPRSRWRVRLFQAYGANPTPMPFAEVFVALQTGVIDGQENPLQQIHGARFQEVQEYLTLSGHVYSPAYLIAGSGRWRELPEDVRSELAAVAREMEGWVMEQGEGMERAVLDSLRAAGMEVSRAHRAAFVAASREIYGEFGRSVEGGDALVRRVLALGGEGGDRVRLAR